MSDHLLLIVEDNEADRDAIGRALDQRASLPNVRYADSVAAARAILEHESIDVAVVDNSLGDGTGLELVEAFPGVRCIVVTGNSSAEVAADALRLGAADFVVKDTRNTHLETVVRAIELTQARRREQEERVARVRELEQLSSAIGGEVSGSVRRVASCGEMLATNVRAGEPFDQAESLLNVSSHKLLGQIDGLITFLRVSSSFGDQFEDIDLAAILDEVLDDLEGQIGKAKIEVGDLPWVHGDPNRLRVLFHCLLSNALKFRASGRNPLIRIGAVSTDRGWRVSIEDNGIGINQRVIGRVFDLFRIGHREGDYPGEGIGLAIAQRIVERHGGIIQLESVESQGTTCYLALPPAHAQPTK